MSYHGTGLTQEFDDGLVSKEGAPELTDQEAEDGAKAWDEVSHQYDRIQYDCIPMQPDLSLKCLPIGRRRKLSRQIRRLQSRGSDLARRR